MPVQFVKLKTTYVLFPTINSTANKTWKQYFHLIVLYNGDKRYTTFQANGYLFPFTRLPFGLTNVGNAFLRVIHGIISDSNIKDFQLILPILLLLAKLMKGTMGDLTLHWTMTNVFSAKCIFVTLDTKQKIIRCNLIQKDWNSSSLCEI